MKNFFFFLLLPALSFAQIKGAETASASAGKTVKAKPKAADGFTINGSVQGLADGPVKITTTQGEQVIASGIAKNGVFIMNGKIEEPGLYWLTLGKEQPQYLFLENSPIKITGKQKDIKNLQIEGSQSHNVFLTFQRTFNPLLANLNAVVMEINRTTSEEKKAPLMSQYEEAQKKIGEEIERFITTNHSSYASLFTVVVALQTGQSPAVAEHSFNLLDENLRNSKAGKELQNYIASAKIGAIGTDAIEFTQNDTNDKPVSLSSFRGKYVLLDFWASWCKPCRMENPNVVKAYNKFKEKNFTILSVSLDQQKGSWVGAIEKDGLAWTHVSDLKFWNNAVAELYHVQSIPQNYLIDPAGKIVAKDLRGEDLDKKLCELLGCN